MQIDRQIAELKLERVRCGVRVINYSRSAMLESERIASAAEPFQEKPLPGVDRTE